MKQKRVLQICLGRFFASFLLGLICCATGCGRKQSDLRRTGYVDLGNGVKMEFVFIEPGAFKMGSEDKDPKEFIDEKPAHDVLLTHAFYMGKYEVKQKEWLTVMGKNPSEFEGPDLPVERVSWDEAQTFVKKLRKKTGLKFELPTEAQWEYACRAETTTRFFWGNDELVATNYAWFDKDAGRATHPVGTKKPNPWGLYDMCGNVWEWCADSYNHYWPGEATDPLTVSVSADELHVVRGGGCANKIGGMRPSNRSSEYRGIRCFGLRCVVLTEERAPAPQATQPTRPRKASRIK